MYWLKNEEITVGIVAHGAEMKSLKDNKTGTEYLWCADSAYWGRTSPVLFPLVGNYKNKKTYFQGKEYSLGQHGFARDMEFTLESQTDDEIWFVLESTEETLEKYPFEFKLSLGYKIYGRTVEVLWKVENPAKETMYFSIGGHPAFNCPINVDEKQTDYRLKFDTSEPLISGVIDATGALSENTKTFVLENQEMPITEDLFDEDALIIEQNQAQRVSLVAPDGKEHLEVAFDAPLFGIWSPVGKHAPFVCIEPWYGRCDRADFNQKLEEREWGNVLASGEVFERSYTITVK